MRERDGRQLTLRLGHAATARVAAARQRVDALVRRLERRDARTLVAALRARTVTAGSRLPDLIERRRLAAAGRARTLAARLDALSPLAVLGRGYALCWNEDRTSIIRSAHAVTTGDHVRVTLADGEIGCRVEDTRS
jgi:exodeoxyribonuclease VII large subunit